MVHDFASVWGSLVSTLGLPDHVQEDKAFSLPALLQGLPSEEPGRSGGTPRPRPPESSPLAGQFGAKLLASLSELQLGL